MPEPTYLSTPTFTHHHNHSLAVPPTTSSTLLLNATFVPSNVAFGLNTLINTELSLANVSSFTNLVWPGVFSLGRKRNV